MNEMENMMEYGVNDECYATVSSRSRSGIYLNLDNGQTAFAYDGCGLQAGQKVICVVKKPALGYSRTRVEISHVCDYAMIA